MSLENFDTLIAGECSGTIRDAFIAEGVNAISCDLKATEKPGPHIQANWENVIPLKKWKRVIIHPVCTTLSVSGNWVYAAGKSKHNERVIQAAYVQNLWTFCIENSESVCLENPRGVIATMTQMGKATQSLQPYEFGDDASKLTDIWLHNLPLLEKDPALRVPGRLVICNGKQVERWANQTDSGQNRLGPSEERAAERAKTYPGIARAMAKGWK